MIRKIELMHELFGRSEGHRCDECANLICGRYRSRVLRKCSAYGLTHSDASDWAKRWEACGLFNKEYTGIPVIKINKQNNNNKNDTEVIDGQIMMFERMGENGVD